MDKQQIYQEVKAIMVKLFETNADDITLDAKLYEDLELDSIDAVDLVVYLQKMTGKKINPEMFKSVRTVEDVVNAVDQLLQNK
ncbi:acyl carrier protein [Pragia fontium]|uniref:Acyl carrier protein n=2 Tax=Pragia fontium TaxID=82985 RepID=A0AAJ4WD47_9GAMM|nr:acyl carrier protein [Pragia fontium]AKJ40704.1 acyl carrier protein [Pragia fontium]SFD32258.1 acyl carrier protein [Pragia fontium DSM 5563 = ATCC 49100]SUB84262.1 Acyl carrier protein [Pragia fontium]VEJ57144.1 Acyl carrier protein [Pragia fontium]GKX63744.1 acyl carrier protein [Pragia fontium]